MKYTPENITELGANEIFVFGSNLEGRHGGGAARVAYNKFGAISGVGVGLQGNSYAIPTMHGGIEAIKPYVDEFASFVENHPELTFYVTRIGCGIAGFDDKDIAPLFDSVFDRDNVFLPKSFHSIINHMRQLDSETKGMLFHSVPIKFYDEDMIKMESMSLEEKNIYMISLKNNGKYHIKHESPVNTENYPLLNTTANGHHIIAVTNKTFAIIADNLLYSNRENWGIDFGQKILSVVAKDASDDDFPYGQFVVLLEDGTIRLLWSDVCINKLSDNNNYVSVTSGCCGLVFGLKSDGTVDVFNFTSENLYIADEVTRWSDITQIDAGPRHIVGLKKDGTVVASGKPSACKPLEEWKDIKKIYVSKAAPYWGKENDLTFGIGNDGWLQVEGDCWSKGKEFWKRIRAQYDVSDVIENGYMVWVRTNDGELRCITYYSKMNYWDEIEFVKKYPNFRFIDTYGDITVIVDESGEFRIMSSNIERKWWNYNLK